MSKLGEILILKNLVSKSQIDSALEIQKKRKALGNIVLLGDILLEKGAIEKQDLYSAVRELAPDILSGREAVTAYVMRCIAFSLGDGYLQSISFQKTNEMHLFEIFDKLGYMTFKSQKIYITGLMKPFIEDLEVGVLEKFTRLHENGNPIYFYDGKKVHIDFIPKLNLGLRQIILSKDEYNIILNSSVKEVLEHDSKGTFNGELPYSVHSIVADACAQNCSDIHIIPKTTDYYIFFRIDGEFVLQPKYTLDAERGRSLVFAFKKLGSGGSFRADDTREVKDARVTLGETCGGVDARIVLNPDGQRMGDEELVARIFKTKKLERIPLEEQGYFKEDVKVIERAFRRSNGLFLLSGVTGSGKTTLAMQLLMGDTQRKWETIEDPIEYIIPNKNICQHQINTPKDGATLGFNELVTGFKRADPDGLLIAEIRRNPTLLLAIIEAANAGQLVVSTVHIRSAFEIYRAMSEIFKIEYFTTSSLIIFSHNQLLLKSLCQNCRVEDTKKSNHSSLLKYRDELPYFVKDELNDYLENPFKTYLKNPAGCAECGASGFKGRTPVYEYFYPDVDFIKWLLDEEPDRYEIEKRVCSGNNRLGVNKLQIFLRKLEAGIFEADSKTIEKLM
ncbi:MAG: hypothetical protein A3F91_09275 [Flavobacteria bacterium RIFCSPLOWO2_12_FULL_35_11]|nr:MAG: hypothetical protein A3F91_09275 [Flavobacteria bacterium RIFCSPLOWO2_12_FULL_35_11]